MRRYFSVCFFCGRLPYAIHDSIVPPSLENNKATLPGLAPRLAPSQHTQSYPEPSNLINMVCGIGGSKTVQRKLVLL